MSEKKNHHPMCVHCQPDDLPMAPHSKAHHLSNVAALHGIMTREFMEEALSEMDAGPRQLLYADTCSEIFHQDRELQTLFVEYQKRMDALQAARRAVLDHLERRVGSETLHKEYTRPLIGKPTWDEARSVWVHDDETAEKLKANERQRVFSELMGRSLRNYNPGCNVRVGFLNGTVLNGYERTKPEIIQRDDGHTEMVLRIVLDEESGLPKFEKLDNGAGSVGYYAENFLGDLPSDKKSEVTFEFKSNESPALAPSKNMVLVDRVRCQVCQGSRVNSGKDCSCCHGRGEELMAVDQGGLRFFLSALLRGAAGMDLQVQAQILVDALMARPPAVQITRVVSGQLKTFDYPQAVHVVYPGDKLEIEFAGYGWTERIDADGSRFLLSGTRHEALNGPFKLMLPKVLGGDL